MSKQLSGIVIPTILPLDTEGTIDPKSLGRLVARALEGGVQGCWVNGTSGGFHHASDQQREHAIEIVIEAVAGRVPVIAHVGDTSLARATTRAQHARELGADYVAAITPYYLELERDELEDHHRRIAEAFGAPILMYQHPATGDRGLSIESIIALAEQGVVRGIKESGPDLEHFEKLCAVVAESKVDFVCMHGAGATALDSLSRGGDGLVTVMANLLPRTMALLFDTMRGGAIEDAHRLQEVVVELTNAIKSAIPKRSTASSVVTAYAYILKELGIFETATVFEPLISLDATEMEALSNEVLPLIESAEQVAASCTDANA